MSEQRKRPRGTPTGRTPKQLGKRLVPRTSGATELVKGKKKLSLLDISTKQSSVMAEGAVPHAMASLPSTRTQALPGSWTADEERALVEFIMMTTRGDSWPRTINEKFWEAAAMFVSQRCNIRQRTCKTN